MQTVQLGATDLNVSRIAFGCWQLSPAFWGDIPLSPWEEAVRAAADLGVNFIDTADAYGNGYAETALGEVFQRHRLRDRFVLATKFYWRIEANGERFPDTTYAYIRRACEASLKRLRTDRIDLYQIHAFDPLTRPDEVACALTELRREGKIRWVGVSNLNAEQMRMYGRHFDIACLQPPYSLLNRKIEADELPYCLSRRIGVIAYSPLFRGLLAGRYDRSTTFSDRRAELPEFTGERFGRILDALDRLRPLAAGHGLTIAQLAIRWVLTHPALTAAIVGVKQREHIEGIVAAADAPLPHDDWHRVARELDAAAR